VNELAVIRAREAEEGRLFGRGLAFPVRLDGQGRVAWSVGATSVRESIRIILTTEPGERLNLPEFGARLRGFLFSPNTPATRRLVRDEIEGALRRWEPRVSLIGVTVDPDDIDERTAIATVRYSLVATRAADQLQLRVSLGG
jgi:phage baseplate assembly protein W